MVRERAPCPFVVVKKKKCIKNIRAYRCKVFLAWEKNRCRPNCLRYIPGKLTTFGFVRFNIIKVLKDESQPRLNRVKGPFKRFQHCFNMRSTQLLNQMSGTFEQVVQHC